MANRQSDDMSTRGRDSNEALLSEIERIARKKGLRASSRPELFRAMERALNKRGSLTYVLAGSQPRVQTLLDVAYFGGESPLGLFVAAHWITTEDIAAFQANREEEERNATLLQRAQEAAGLSDEEMDKAIQVMQALSDILAQMRQQGDPPLGIDAVHIPGPQSQAVAEDGVACRSDE